MNTDRYPDEVTAQLKKVEKRERRFSLGVITVFSVLLLAGFSAYINGGNFSGNEVKGSNDYSLTTPSLSINQTQAVQGVYLDNSTESDGYPPGQLDNRLYNVPTEIGGNCCSDY